MKVKDRTQTGWTYPRNGGPGTAELPVIEATVRQLDEQIAKLQRAAIVLESRLTPVLHEPEPPKADPSDSGVLPAQSALATKLRQQVQEVANISYWFTSITRRLEI